MPFPPLQKIFYQTLQAGIMKENASPIDWTVFILQCFKMVSSFAFEGYFLLFERHKSQFKTIFQTKMLFSSCTIVKRHPNTFTFLKTYRESICGVQKLILCLKCIFHFLKKKLRSVVKHSRHLIQPANRKLQRAFEDITGVLCQLYSQSSYFLFLIY